MTKTLFVGNLDYSTTEQQLREVFAAHGPVVSASVVLDRVTGRSRGFGFVEYESGDVAQHAIGALDGTEVDGRELIVNVARPRGEGRGGKDGGGRGGFGPGRGRPR
jgi:cold-inducible RNA-binding protein